MKIKFWMFAAVFAAIGMASCSSDDPETVVEPPVPEEGEEVSANMAVDGYMSSHYLWNAEYKKLTPDFNLSSEVFLKKSLEGVAAQNNANKEDGYFDADGVHHWYTYITKSKSKSTNGTRVDVQPNPAEVRFGYGFQGVVPTNVDGKIYIGILGVINGSPIAKTKLSGSNETINRGIYISKVDGTAISASNYNSLKAKLFPNTAGSSVKLNLVNIVPDKGSGFDVNNIGAVTVSAANYDYDPILFKRIVASKSDPDIKIGYISYGQFIMSHDKELVKTFEELNFSAGGQLSDLVLDLRYNQGGHLLSSVLLATLVTGDAYKDAVYCSTQFNAERMKKEESRVYKIGNPSTGEGHYPIIAEALASAANLKRVYVLTGPYTASASELIINGLRGLDIDVRIVGDKTNGKNVGMEGVYIDGRNGYNYEFYPITMRLQNAKNFSDYSTGFEPDVLVKDNDTKYVVGAYASSADPLSGYALTWILDDKKPNSAGAITRACATTYVAEPTLIEPLYKGAITCPKAL